MRVVLILLLLISSNVGAGDEGEVLVESSPSWSDLGQPEQQAAYKFIESSKCSYVYTPGQIVPNPSGKFPAALPYGTGEVRPIEKNDSITYVVGVPVNIEVFTNPSLINKIKPPKQSKGQPIIYPSPREECSSGKKSVHSGLCVGKVSCHSANLKITADVFCKTTGAGACPDARRCALESDFSRTTGRGSEGHRIFFGQKTRGGAVVTPKQKEEAVR